MNTTHATQARHAKKARNPALALILGTALLLGVSAPSLRADSIDFFVDMTIVYVPPTPVYSTNSDGDRYVSGYTNTYEEQRTRYKNEVTQKHNTYMAGADKKLKTGYAPITKTKEGITEEGVTEAEGAVEEANEGDITSPTAAKLGRGDLDGDGVLSDAEVAALRKSRVCMKAQRFGTERKLDANGDGTFNVSEAAAGVKGIGWDGSDDGASQVNAQIRTIRARQAEMSKSR
jgi:hypothetical protein